MASDKQQLISSSVISLLLTFSGLSIFSMVSYGYRLWPKAIIYAGKSFAFFGLFTKTHPLKASYWFWGIFIVLTLIVLFSRVNSEINKDKARERYRETEASRNTEVYCSKCDQYLGNGLNYDMPCPRCGSNRYILK